MRFTRNQGRLPYVIGLCVLAWSASARADVTSAANDSEVWHSFGTLLLYRLGTGSCPSAEWLCPGVQLVDPNDSAHVRTIESIARRASDAYGRDALAVGGRIPLDMNPQCILGLWLTKRFPRTRLGDCGRRQFERSIEHACLVALPPGDGAWQDRLETTLLTSDDTQAALSPRGPFRSAEVPYLYLYLIDSARSEEARHKATNCLARSLWENYGLEPGLGQYLTLLDRGQESDCRWLEVASELERLGAHSGAKRVYGRVLENTESADEARQAFERLAHLLLLESRRREATAAWERLSRRFPNTQCTVPEVRDFLRDFCTHREETARRFIGELTRTTTEAAALPWCRSLDDLWSPPEAPEQWQTVIDTAAPGSLSEQWGRVFQARALLGAGRTDAAGLSIRGLIQAVNPCIRAQSAGVSAAIARARGNMMEAARLYLDAIQIDRPTPLPPWARKLGQIQPPRAESSMDEARAHTLFLEGFNDLIDSDFAAAIDKLERVATEPFSLPASLCSVLPCVMMLAYLGGGDYAQAEAWGYRALQEYSRDHPHDTEIRDYLAKTQDVDMAVTSLVAMLRGATVCSAAAPAALQRAIRVHEAVASLDRAGSGTEAARAGMMQLYARAKKYHLVHLLMAEHHSLRQRWAERNSRDFDPGLELLAFTAQLLSDRPVEQIRENLAAATGEKTGQDQMYRFALLARKVGRLDLMRSVLDLALGDETWVATPEILEDIARMYLAAASHPKAIEAYRRIVATSSDSARVESTQLKIIDIYAEDLQNYARAIQECEAFTRKYPDSLRVSHVEFLVGRFAYLMKDYAGAVGQFDAFLKKYPQHSQVGQAMMLAGLSRMAEGNTQDAIRRFREIIRRYPEGDLTSRSKFLIGYAQVSDQQYSAALETFRQLIEQFPESPYASQARNLIERLKKVAP